MNYYQLFIEALFELAKFLVFLQMVGWLVAFASISLDKEYRVKTIRGVLGYFCWTFFWLPMIINEIRKDCQKEREWKELERGYRK